MKIKDNTVVLLMTVPLFTLWWFLYDIHSNSYPQNGEVFFVLLCISLIFLKATYAVTTYSKKMVVIGLLYYALALIPSVLVLLFKI